MVTWVSVTHILQTAWDSCDFGPPCGDDDDAHTTWWLDIIREKSGDMGFGSLVNAILKNGFDPNSPVGWTESGGRGSINEGHHRIVAAILLCLDEIPTTPYGGGDGSICAHNCNCNGEGDYPIETDL